jgi:DNA-binding transcriptional regulator YiaG
MDKTKKKRENEASVESEILAALSEFTEALEKGEVTRRLTCRQIKLNLEPTSYDADSVKQVRKLLGVSQALFAKILGVSRFEPGNRASILPTRWRAASWMKFGMIRLTGWIG